MYFKLILLTKNSSCGPASFSSMVRSRRQHMNLAGNRTWFWLQTLLWVSVKERGTITWWTSLISQQLFALVIVPHNWVPAHLLHSGCPPAYLLPTADIHQVHSGWDNFAFSSWVSSLPRLPQPRFCCLEETDPSPNLCHCPFLQDLHGGTAFSCDGEWQRKAQQPLRLRGNDLSTLPRVQESGWGCPWQKTPGQRRQLSCWSCAICPYGPGVVSDMTKYKGYWCLTLPNSAKGTLRPGCWWGAKHLELLSATPYWPKHHLPASKNQSARLGSCRNVLARLGLQLP